MGPGHGSAGLGQCWSHGRAKLDLADVSGTMKRDKKAHPPPQFPATAWLLQLQEGCSLLLAGIPGLHSPGHLCLPRPGGTVCAWDTVRCPRTPSALPHHPWEILTLPGPRQLVLLWLQRCGLDSRILNLFSNLNDSMTQNDSVPAQVAILPSASCAAPSLSHLETLLCLQLCQGRCLVIAHGRGWDVMILKVSSNPNHSVIL